MSGRTAVRELDLSSMEGMLLTLEVVLAAACQEVHLEVGLVVCRCAGPSCIR